MAGASTVRCIAVLSASLYARGRLVWWAEWQKGSPSASGVAVRVCGVYVCILVVLLFPFHCATHQVCWWHIRVSVGVSGVRSRTVQSATFTTMLCTYCSGGLLSCTRW